MDDDNIDECKGDYEDNEGDNEGLRAKRSKSIQLGLGFGQVRVNKLVKDIRPEKLPFLIICLKL